MRRFPAWGWSVIIFGIIIIGIGLGGGGPEGRAASRDLYPLLSSLLLVATLFAYMQQHNRSTRKLRMINFATVLVMLYITVPFWHFGVSTDVPIGSVVVIQWWINGVVLALAIMFYFFLRRVTRGLEPGAMAAEDKPERLTV